MRGLVPKAVLTPSGDIKVKVSPNFSPNDLAIPDPMAIPFSKLSIAPYITQETLSMVAFLYQSMFHQKLQHLDFVHLH